MTQPNLLCSFDKFVNSPIKIRIRIVKTIILTFTQNNLDPDSDL